MGAADPLIVEVIYALPGRQVAKTYRLTRPASVADALALAAADPDFSGIDVSGFPVGIFGRVVPTDRLLQTGDRLELYRALPADPKEARRARVHRARAQGAARPKVSGPHRPR